MSDAPGPEDAKLVVLARGALARAGAGSGAAIEPTLHPRGTLGARRSW